MYFSEGFFLALLNDFLTSLFENTEALYTVAEITSITATVFLKISVFRGHGNHIFPSTTSPIFTAASRFICGVAWVEKHRIYL